VGEARWWWDFRNPRTLILAGAELEAARRGRAGSAVSAGEPPVGGRGRRRKGSGRDLAASGWSGQPAATHHWFDFFSSASAEQKLH
jgi:hypothetical protein